MIEKIIEEPLGQKHTVICFCPECAMESFTVTVSDSGSGHNYEFGQVEHWFGGDGACYECGYESYYSDGSL